MSEPSFILDPQFQEAHQAHVRRERIYTGRLASFLVILLMPPGILLDYFVYRKELIPFMWIRLLGSALGAVLWFLYGTSVGRRHVRWLGLCIPFVPALCVSWMIYRSG